MILFLIVSLILVLVDLKCYEKTGKHISILWPIIAFSLILPAWITFPLIALFLIKKVVEWKH